jgi:hypothetical protein
MLLKNITAAEKCGYILKSATETRLPPSSGNFHIPMANGRCGSFIPSHESESPSKRFIGSIGRKTIETILEPERRISRSGAQARQGQWRHSLARLDGGLGSTRRPAIESEASAAAPHVASIGGAEASTQAPE